MSHLDDGQQVVPSIQTVRERKTPREEGVSSPAGPCP